TYALRIVCSRLIARHDASRHHLKIGKTRKRVCDLLRKTFAQVIHFDVFAGIQEWQHSYGMNRDGLGTVMQQEPSQQRAHNDCYGCRACPNEPLQRPPLCGFRQRSSGLAVVRVTFQSLEVGFQFSRRLVTDIAVLLQRLRDDLVESEWYVRV